MLTENDYEVYKGWMRTLCKIVKIKQNKKMKLINQKAELLIQPKGLNGLEKQIEIAARTCYKSESSIKDGSAKDMLSKLVNRKHYSMLEHGTVYLKFDQSKVPDTMVSKYYLNPYSRAKFRDESGMAYITTNYRVLKEHGWTKDLQYWCEPTNNHVKRYTFRLTTSIGIGRELTRHRAFSFAQESSRYCNYSKDKFNNEITFIKPYWLHKATKLQQTEFEFYCKTAEDTYLALLGKWDERKSDRRFKTGFKENPLPPQAAREVLPLCTKSELIMTGFEDDWEDFLDKRLRGTTGKPHPDMVELAKLIENEIKKEE